MDNVEQEVRAAQQLAKEMAKLLHGKGSMVQGAALGSCLSLWLAGHHPLLREGALETWLNMVRSTVPLDEREVLQRYGVKSWDDL